jgi:ABC-type nitrate/sulfonate/bicarbonate transport system substrate-binding protein
MKSTLLIGALAVFLLLPQRAPGQERVKLIYSQFTMTNSATWFAREAGLFERHGLNADLIYVDSAPAVQATVWAFRR